MTSTTTDAGIRAAAGLRRKWMLLALAVLLSLTALAAGAGPRAVAGRAGTKPGPTFWRLPGDIPLKDPNVSYLPGANCGAVTLGASPSVTVGAIPWYAVGHGRVGVSFRRRRAHLPVVGGSLTLDGRATAIVRRRPVAWVKLHLHLRLRYRASGAGSHTQLGLTGAVIVDAFGRSVSKPSIAAFQPFGIGGQGTEVTKSLSYRLSCPTVWDRPGRVLGLRVEFYITGVASRMTAAISPFTPRAAWRIRRVGHGPAWVRKHCHRPSCFPGTGPPP